MPLPSHTAPPAYPQLVLASASEARLRLLKAAGLWVRSVAARVDEAGLAADHRGDPSDLAIMLARAKARQVSEAAPDEIVLGGDQVLACEGIILFKPDTPDAARSQLGFLSGREHRLISAGALVRNGRTLWTGVDSARLRMHDLGKEEIDRYVARHWQKIRHCVGCYRIEAEGSHLFAAVAGDPFTIQGLPLIPLLGHLRQTDLLESLLCDDGPE